MDDIVIRIGDEIRDDVPFGNPDLQPDRHKAWGRPGLDSVRVVMGQRAYEQVNQHALSEPSREVGGILLGKVYRHEGATYVDVIETLRAPTNNAGATHITFTPDSWSEMNKARDMRFPSLRVVGWYHTHPRMDIFLSADDQFLHRNFFPEPWQVALVVEPHKHLGGFFTWNNGTVQPTSGFYERFDTHSRSIFKWHNLPDAATTQMLTPLQVSTSSTLNTTRRNRSWIVPAALGLLGLLALLIGLLGLRAASGVEEVRESLATTQQTVQAISRKVAINEQATAVARAVAGTQTALAHVSQQQTASAATSTHSPFATSTATSISTAVVVTNATSTSVPQSTITPGSEDRSTTTPTGTSAPTADTPPESTATEVSADVTAISTISTATSTVTATVPTTRVPTATPKQAIR